MPWRIFIHHQEPPRLLRLLTAINKIPVNEMQSRKSARRASGPRRRKVALACEPCRERKSRCDGEKPICGPCARRSYTIDRCIYKLENARSASNDEYLALLHRRIRELEQACRQGGIAVSAFQVEDPPAPDHGSGTHERAGPMLSSSGDANQNTAPVEPEGPATTSRTPPVIANPAVEDISQTRPGPQYAQTPGGQVDRSSSAHAELDRLSPFESRSNLTGMGDINSVGEDERPPNQVNEYFGSSSAASLTRLLARSSTYGSNRPPGSNAPSQTNPRQTGPHLTTVQSPLIQEDFSQSRFNVDGSLLPPRDLADHLLECFWDRIYCLYPFFDRDSFQDAYENLWIPRTQPGKTLREQDIGLGSGLNSGPKSFVFLCALNIIFALGCHFADIPIAERESTSYGFFLRAKNHIGLDMLEIRSVGVVQTLLIIGLYSQSTPFPHRCWSSIGIACRLAQGLGLHEAQLDESKDHLELEIHRRTWHGCVMMDKIASMTYGRPSMTSHLSTVPLPGALGLSSAQEPQDLSLMSFYISTIELYQILDSILADVYNSWRGRPNNCPGSGSDATRQVGLDVVIELEEKLFKFESNLPGCLSWTHQSTPTVNPSDQSILNRQRNVLYARFLYLRLLLYRPIFTRLCSESYTRNTRANHLQSALYHSMLSKCAVACVRAAVDLTSLVYDTYRTCYTDTWWYNGFYASTAGIILIISLSVPADAIELPAPDIGTTWQKCEQILQHMAAFSISARNTLQFLSTARTQVLSGQQSRSQQHAAGENLANQNNNHGNSRLMSALGNAPTEGPAHVASADDNVFGQPQFNWDASMGGLGTDEVGFLGPFDFSDFQGWLPDEAL